MVGKIIDNIKAWVKRNVKDLVRLGILFVAFALVGWQVRSFGDWIMACIIWACVEGVIGLIKKRS